VPQRWTVWLVILVVAGSDANRYRASVCNKSPGFRPLFRSLRRCKVGVQDAGDSRDDGLRGALLLS
jgi:hypothetical protein